MSKQYLADRKNELQEFFSSGYHYVSGEKNYGRILWIGIRKNESDFYGLNINFNRRSVRNSIPITKITEIKQALCLPLKDEEEFMTLDIDG